MDELLKLEGRVQMDMESFKLDGAAKFSREMKSTQYSSTVVIHFTAENGWKGVTKPELIKLNDYGLKMAKLDATKSREGCGTHFVKSKDLMAQFVGVMKFEFQNKNQKEQFDGALKASIGTGSTSIDIEGRMALLSQAAKNSGRFSLDARQLGGDATKLGEILKSDEATKCIMQNDSEACGKQMSNMLKYAAENFPQQLNDGAFVESGEDLATYESVPGWTGEVPNPVTLQDLSVARKEFERMVTREEGDYLRASALIKNAAALTDDQYQGLDRTLQTISARLSEIANASLSCFNISPKQAQLCRDAKSNVTSSLKTKAEFVIDRSLFVVHPKDFATWCSAAKQWYDVQFAPNTFGGTDIAANLILSPEAQSSLPAILNYEGILGKPVFFKKEDSAGFVPKDLPCGELGAKMLTKREINLSRLGISDTSVLSAFTYATSLDLSGTENVVKDFGPLRQLRSLRKLVLDGALLQADFEPLRFTSLSDLSVQGVDVGSDGFLFADFTSQGEARDVNLLEGISGMNLQILNLSSTGVDTLEKLKNLPRLRTIIMKHNEYFDEIALKELLDRKAADFKSLREIVVSPESPICGANPIVKCQ